MGSKFFLNRKRTALLLIDVQEKLMPYEERAAEVLEGIQKIVRGCKFLNIPIFVTEQYPEGLGSTLPGIKSVLGSEQSYWSKTSFSCLGSEQIRKVLLEHTVDQWILVGIEAHVCVLQTAKSLICEGKDVAVLNDAISSRSIYDFSTAIAEMRDMGVRISSVETVLFELLESSEAPEFKKVSQLLK